MTKEKKSDAAILQQRAEEIRKTKSSKSGVQPSEAEESEFAESLINTIREPLLALDQDLRVVKASRSFYKFFKVTPGETIGKLIYELGNNQWDIPGLRELLETILPEKTTFDDFEVEQDFSTIGKRIMLLNARQIKRAFGKEKIILLAFEDITERKVAEEAITENSRLTSEYTDVLLNYAHAPIIIWDASLVIKRFNRQFEKMSGYDSTEVIDQKIDILFPKDKIESTLELLKNHLSDEDSEVIEVDILTKDNDIKTVIWNSVNILDKEGTRTIAAIAHDITEHKRTEKSLRESEERFRTLYENAKIGLYRTKPDGTILMANKVLLNTLGYSSFEKLAEINLEKSGFEQTDVRKEFIEKIEKDGEINDFETAWVHQDGSVFFVRESARAIRDSQGITLYYDGIVEDITERKKAENALLESEIKYRAFFENSMDAILLTSPDGETLAVNQAACSMFGYPEEELIRLGRSGIQDYTDPRLTVLLEERKRNGKARGEVTLLRKDGTRFPAEISSAIFENQEGLERTSMIIRDITERKRAENEIAMLAHSLKSIKECVSITDLENKILFVNESFLKTYGYELNELIGKNISMVRSQSNEQAQIDKILPATIQGEWHGELMNRKKDGTEFPVYLSTTMIKVKENKVLGLIGVASDITERKLAETELIKAKEKAEESDHLKSAFLANMSHEVRTPLNSIIGFSGLLADPYFEEDQKNEFIQHIITNSNNLLTIISDIMDISKLESGECKIRKGQINARKFISTVKEQYAFQAKENELELKLVLPENTEETIIVADVERLWQIFNNLMSNALKFTANGRIEIGFQPRGKMVEFFVKDTGIGIQPEYHDKIFERFRQVDTEITRKFGGNGLGLAISKNLIELMGGKIWLESQPGKGSVFSFTLPNSLEPK